MSYRTVEIAWIPHGPRAWVTFTAARQEAARLWSELVERHHRIRCRGSMRWPGKARWERWAKRKYPNLHSQSIQQTIGEFCEAVDSCRQLRKSGQATKYPWRKSKYRDVVYTNQAARIRHGWLILPNGNAGDLRIKIPAVELPGRLMEVRLSFGTARLCFEVKDEAKAEKRVVGVDLGVNSILAATDGKKVVIVSGREIKATVQWRNKRLASISAKLSKKKKGSRRSRRLQRRKHRTLDKAHRRVKDAVHKATRIVADEFPNAKVYVGEPFNDAAQKAAPKQAQQISQAVPGLAIRLLDYKTCGAIVVNEAYSSQTCPVCGERSKHRRIFRCPKCGTVLPRDAVGSINIRRIGMFGKLVPREELPKRVVFKYPGNFPGSSGGHPASSSA